MQPSGLEAPQEDAGPETSLVEQIAALELPGLTDLRYARMASIQLGNGSLEVKPVKDLEDPRNYWAAHYEDWDRWLFEHYLPEELQRSYGATLRSELLAQAGAGEDEWVEVLVEVDKGGFMLPSRSSWERLRPQYAVENIAQAVAQRTNGRQQWEQLWTMRCAGVMPGASTTIRSNCWKKPPTKPLLPIPAACRERFFSKSAATRRTSTESRSDPYSARGVKTNARTAGLRNRPHSRGDAKRILARH